MFEYPETIKIKKIQRPGYFGINSYPKSKMTICAQLHSKTGAYVTGLTEDEEREFEKELNLESKKLGKRSPWWGEVFNVDYAIRLNATKTTEFVLDNAMDKLKYRVMLASDKIANSELEKSPNALFYIDNAELKAKFEMESLNWEFEGMSLILKLTPEEQRGSLRLFGKIGVDTLSEVMLKAQLAQELKKDPKEFVTILNDKNLKTRMFIQELIEKSLIKRKGIYYLHGEDTIASSTDECISFFSDIKNQPTRLILETRLGKTKKDDKEDKIIKKFSNKD